MKPELEKVLAELNKKNPNTIGTVTSMETLQVKRITTGSIYLDWATGGGWPMGRVVELYGHPSSGKSTLATVTIAEAQKKGLTCAYLDCENAFDIDYAKLLGVDVDSLIISQATEGEATFDVLFGLCRGGVDVVVVDSVASMVPKAEFEADMNQPGIALAARMMSRGLRVLNAHQKETLIIFTNQIRMTPGAYGNPETTSGGKALGHYASVRVDVRKGEFIEDSDKKKMGQVVKFKVTKNKTAPPYRQGYFKLMYNGEIDVTDELVSVGLESKKIGQRGSMYDVLGGSYKGRRELQEALADPQFRERYIEEVVNAD